MRSARNRLRDAQIEGLSFDSRFDLTYNASHALALAALRWHGYRSENRYLVFQCLEHTLRINPESGKSLRSAISGATRRNMRVTWKQMNS